MPASDQHASTPQRTHFKRPRLAQSLLEGGREGVSKRDDEDNIKKSVSEGAEKKAKDEVSKLEYGWVCGLKAGYHCTEEDPNVGPPERVEQCSGPKRSLVRTASSTTVRIFPSGHEHLKQRLLKDINIVTGKHYTAWFHIDCRTFRVPMESGKTCLKC
jgi:hypothetical protein